MRAINRIFLHCSATREGKNFNVKHIRRWHKRRGFLDVGYHWVVLLDGTIQEGRPEHQRGAHAAGFNKDSIGICYIGGLDANRKPKDTRTQAQLVSMDRLIDRCRKLYGNHLEVWGHNDVSSKACPCFDVREDRWERRR